MNDHQKAILGVVRDACVSKTAAAGGGDGAELSEKAQAISDLMGEADLGCSLEPVRKILSLLLDEELPGGSSGRFVGCVVVRQPTTEGGEEGEPAFVAGTTYGGALRAFDLTRGEHTLAADHVRPATEEEVTAFFTAVEESTQVSNAHVALALDAVMA